MNKKYIKRILAIAFSCILLLSAYGCNRQSDVKENERLNESSSNTGNYKVMEIGSSDCVDGGKHSLSEYPTWSYENLNIHLDPSAPQEYTVCFNGVTYVGQYLRSSMCPPCTYTYHKYQGDHASFKINATTGELVSIIMSPAEPTDYATLTENECRSIADNIACQYLNPDEYLVKTSSSSIGISVFYYKEVNGYRTTDDMAITVRDDGSIAAFGYLTLGAFSDESVALPDKDEAIKSLENKLNEMYADVPSWTGYSIYDVVALKLEDGSPALLFTVNIDIKVEDPENEGHYSIGGPQIRLLVTSEMTTEIGICD